VEHTHETTTATTTATLTNFEENQQTPRDTKRPPKGIEGPSETAKNKLLRFPYALPSTPNSQLSGAVDADFFVTGIVPDFTRVCYAFGPCFLSPFVHLILILKEPITAKDVTACERGQPGIFLSRANPF